jgi:hypothetical protein
MDLQPLLFIQVYFLLLTDEDLQLKFCFQTLFFNNIFISNSFVKQNVCLIVKYIFKWNFFKIAITKIIPVILIVFSMFYIWNIMSSHHCSLVDNNSKEFIFKLLLNYFFYSLTWLSCQKCVFLQINCFLNFDLICNFFKSSCWLLLKSFKNNCCHLR